MTTVTTAPAIGFVKDDRTESWLRSYDVTFTGPTVIKLCDVDRKSSRHNQAREQAINPEGLERYRHAIRNGSQLPAIVVFKSNGKWVIVDGNHRDQAALDEKLEKVRAYVIDPHTPSEAITLMTVAANTMNGMSVDKSWSLRNALYLIATGYTKETVARALSVSVSTIDAHQRERESANRATKLRVNNWDTMPVRMRQVIGRVRLDKPFVIIAEAAIQTHAGYNSDFGAVITEINAAANQEDAVEIATKWARTVTEHAKQEQRRGTTRAASNHKLGILTGLGKIKAFNMGVFNATFATDEDRKVINTRIDEAMEKLIDMKFRLNGRESTEEDVIEMVTHLGTKD